MYDRMTNNAASSTDFYSEKQVKYDYPDINVIAPLIVTLLVVFTALAEIIDLSKIKK